MINIVWDPGFKKAYQKKIKTYDNLEKKFWKTMKLFSSNPFNLLFHLIPVYGNSYPLIPNPALVRP